MSGESAESALLSPNFSGHGKFIKTLKHCLIYFYLCAARVLSPAISQTVRISNGLALVIFSLANVDVKQQINDREMPCSRCEMTHDPFSNLPHTANWKASHCKYPGTHLNILRCYFLAVFNVFFLLRSQCYAVTLSVTAIRHSKQWKYFCWHINWSKVLLAPRHAEAEKTATQREKSPDKRWMVDNTEWSAHSCRMA